VPDHLARAARLPTAGLADHAAIPIGASPVDAALPTAVPAPVSRSSSAALRGPAELGRASAAHAGRGRGPRTRVVPRLAAGLAHAV
jgi:hypothetical protein